MKARLIETNCQSCSINLDGFLGLGKSPSSGGGSEPNKASLLLQLLFTNLTHCPGNCSRSLALFLLFVLIHLRLRTGTNSGTNCSRGCSDELMRRGGLKDEIWSVFAR